MSEEQLFKVEIEKEVDDMISWFTHNYEQEISGWLVGVIGTDTIRIIEILFPHQEVGGASVDTDAKALIKLRKEYGDKCLQIIGHFHSHNDMGNFWSTTDDDFIKQYMEQRDIAIFLVSSKANGHRLRLEVRKPINFSMDEVDYDVIFNDEGLGDRMRSIIKDKVTEVKIVTSNYGYQSNEYYGYGHGMLGLQDGDKILDLEDMQDVNVDAEVDAMIKFNPNDNSVILRGLSYHQYGQLENIGLGKSTFTAEAGNTWAMRFEPKKKKGAMKIIQEFRDFMKDEKTREEELNGEMEDTV